MIYQRPAAVRPRPLRMLSITAVWGACFVAIRWGLRDAPVLWFASLRSLVAGVALVGLAVAQRRPLPAGARTWWPITTLAVVNAGLAFAAMFAGVAGLATGTAAVLANAQPLLIVLPAWWLYGERPTPRSAAGLAVGFAGLVVVAVPGGGGKGAWLSIVAAAAITAGTLVVRRLEQVDVVHTAGWHFLLGGAGLAVVAIAVEGAPRINWTPRFVAVLTFLALVGTALAFWVWFVEALRSPLAPLAAWTFLTPLFGIGFAYVAGADKPGGWTVAGLVLVLVALWAILRGDSSSPPDPAAR